MRTKILSSVLACIAIALLAVPFSKSGEYVSYTKVGDPVPAFSATTLDGKEFSTAAAKGSVVLLNFWATWCPPCQMEMPRLEKEVWQKYGGRDFTMIAIAREQSAEEITVYRAKNKYTFPMAPDPKRQVYGKFANAGIPRNYLLNREGKILFQSVGYDLKEFEKMLGILKKELGR
jgi:thiol-disulfide isomerase/thioredoxin